NHAIGRAKDDSTSIIGENVVETKASAQQPGRMQMLEQIENLGREPRRSHWTPRCFGKPTPQCSTARECGHEDRSAVMLERINRFDGPSGNGGEDTFEFGTHPAAREVQFAPVGCR